jgi:hypothetical protein
VARGEVVVVVVVVVVLGQASGEWEASIYRAPSRNFAR